MTTSDDNMRDHVVYLLNGGGAHLNFERAFADLPVPLRGAKPEGLPYTPWRLLEHLRICQRDILEFSTNPNYEELPFPEGYWPEGDAPPDELAWQSSMESIRTDQKAMVELVRNTATDLFAKIPWGDGQTILREALLIADHNSYHLGQMVIVRTLLGVEPEE
jgi:hypothetical protein